MESVDHRALASRFYNAGWELLEAPSRDDDDNALLLTNAFASRAHWLEAGGTQQWIISEWMVSRAAAATGWSDLALFFGMRAFRGAQEPSVADWVVASAAEGVARAYAAAGDDVQRDEWIERAQLLVEAIVNPQDRALIASQVASLLT